MVKIAKFLVLRPKIKFYLCAIAYPSILFLPTQLFFAFPELFLFFFSFLFLYITVSMSG